MAIYNPKSLKAEEFIHDQEILDTIAYAEANKRNVELIDAILDKARPRKSGNGVTCAGLDHREASVLLACDLPDKIEEIDMVINIGMLRAGNTDYVANEICRLKEACGRRILKVIIETCLLTEEEKKTMCRIVTECGADFIKTSTGFSTGGATPEDIKLFAENVGPNVRIKAAGGIATLEDAENFVKLGATRLGTSRVLKLVREKEQA